jgi:hypothetical protein
MTIDHVKNSGSNKIVVRHERSLTRSTPFIQYDTAPSVTKKRPQRRPDAM